MKLESAERQRCDRRKRGDWRVVRRASKLNGMAGIVR
jgi:hypothetical protein